MYVLAIKSSAEYDVQHDVSLPTSLMFLKEVTC